MSNKKYNCTQQELYAVCALGWENCSRNLEKFSALKARYTPDFVAEKKSEVERISRMPDHHRRSASLEVRRLELKQAAFACLDAFRNLQLYIRETWLEEDELFSRLKSAGQSHYKDAVNLKWEACRSLFVSADAFMTENLIALTANKNMNPEFPLTFSTLFSEFNRLYAYYLDGVRDSQSESGEKFSANMKMYSELMHMFTDAKTIFKHDPLILKQFVFESVVLMVSGPGTAGIKGTVNVDAGLKPDWSTLSLVISETGDEAGVEENGSFRFSQMASGQYTIVVSMPGFISQSFFKIQVNSGSYTQLNIQLIKETTL